MEWKLLRHTLLRELISENPEPEWRETYQIALRDIEKMGSFPSGIYEQAVQEKFIEMFRGWQVQLHSLFPGICWSGVRDSALKELHGPLRENDPLLSVLTGREEAEAMRIRLRPPLIIGNPEGEGREKVVISTEGEWTFTIKKHSFRMIHFRYS